MRGNILEEMLLIQEPSVIKLYEEMMRIAGFFLAPVFTIALLLEYFGEMDFGGVVKKLFLITIFMGSNRIGLSNRIHIFITVNFLILFTIDFFCFRVYWKQFNGFNSFWMVSSNTFGKFDNTFLR